MAAIRPPLLLLLLLLTTTTVLLLPLHQRLPALWLCALVCADCFCFFC
jgi:hypothetical protein